MGGGKSKVPCPKCVCIFFSTPLSLSMCADVRFYSICAYALCMCGYVLAVCVCACILLCVCDVYVNEFLACVDVCFICLYTLHVCDMNITLCQCL